MVTKEVIKKVHLCDECGEETYVERCLGCFIEHCSTCRKKMGREYQLKVHTSGSGDGYFCNACDVDPPERVKKLHLAYRHIQSLRNEEQGWMEDFERRKVIAEKELLVLYSGYKKQK